MFGSNIREEYLHRAEEAEKQERSAKDVQVKKAWERIVVGYLELAEIVRRREGKLTYAAATVNSTGLP